jgi:hypothetical protein
MRKFLSIISVFFLICASLDAQIKITNSNIELYRDSVKIKIFGQKTLPAYLPDSIFQNVSTLRYVSRNPFLTHSNLKNIDCFITKLTNNITDVPSYVYYPKTTNGKLFVYHSGHCAGNSVGEDAWFNGGDTSAITISRLIQEGYTVLALPMVFYNSTPKTYDFSPDPTYSRCNNNHAQLFEDFNFSDTILRNYFKPLLSGLNKLGRNNFTEVYLGGLSGGGWTTTLYSAIDTTIKRSYIIAGSSPKKFWSVQGDYEQQYPPIFDRLLSYEDMYVLGSAGQGREVIQINNRYDIC